MNGTIIVTPGQRLSVHTYVADDAGWQATSHLIELASQVILVDTPLTVGDGQEVLDYSANLGKPITRVYVSHAHPDHYAGIGLFDAPLYAVASVRETINTIGMQRIVNINNLTGGGELAVPDLKEIKHTVESGEEIIDGVRFSFEHVGSAEAADQLVIDLLDEGILVAQDLVFNRVHAFLAEQHFDDWSAALDEFEARGHSTVLAGHGKPGNRSLFEETRTYLSAARAALAVSSGAEDLNQRLDSLYPEHGGRGMQSVQNYFLFANKS
jgi:glyoxylase-like metal-dependent hydrolase (beta-lactamase superfamily II)